MSGETPELLNEDQRDRLDAGPVEIDETGVPAVDRLLSALAVASRWSHDSTQWWEPTYTGFGPIEAGMCPNDLIQRAANEAAEEIRILATRAQENR